MSNTPSNLPPPAARFTAAADRAPVSPPIHRAGYISHFVPRMKTASHAPFPCLSLAIIIGAMSLLRLGVCHAQPSLPPGQLPPYHLTDLGNLGGSEITVYSMNDFSAVVGAAFPSNSPVESAFLWSFTNGLTTLWANGRAYDINNLNQLVGRSGDEAVMWTNGTVVPLGFSGNYAHATGINDSGVVVGTFNSLGYSAFAWSNGVWRTLPEFSQHTTAGMKINRSGNIVGFSNRGGGNRSSVTWLNGGTQLTEMLGASEGAAINDSNFAVLNALSPYFWNGTQAVNIAANGRAEDINNWGWVVGSTVFPGGLIEHAFLWVDDNANQIAEPTELRNLNNAIPTNSGWILRTASAVNNRGHIAGVGTFYGVKRAFLLSASPTITVQPQDAYVTNGQSAMFSVSTFDVGPVGFQWRLNGTNIGAGGTFLGVSASNLIVSAANAPLAGDYTVVVSNGYGSMTSQVARLVIAMPGIDADGDGIPDLLEFRIGTRSDKWDTDGDGLSDYDELFVRGTDPLKADSDGDGMPDSWEVAHGLNPRVNDANDDLDGDGVSNLAEYNYNLTHANALDPARAFSDGVRNDFLVFNSFPRETRYTYDKIDRLISAEYGNGLGIAYAYDPNGNPVRTTHLRQNTNSLLPSLWRFIHGVTNTTLLAPYADSDGDGWTDWQEWKAGTDPTDAQSIPGLLSNPGTNIASLTLPFTPSNFVVGVGQLDGTGPKEIVIGADGNPGTNSNHLLVLTQGPTTWATQRVEVGPFGITSITVGQVANRPSPAIYVGLRGPTNGSGRIVEFMRSGGVWQSNVVAVSTNDFVDVLGIRGGTNLLVCISTNGIDGGLFALSSTNGLWLSTVESTNRSDRAVGTIDPVWSRFFRDASVRLLTSNRVEIIAGEREALKNGFLLPTNWVFNPATGKFYFQSTNALNWDDGEIFAQSYGSHLATLADGTENAWVAARFTKPYWMGLYFVHYGGSADNFRGAWVSSGQSPNLFYFSSYFTPLWEITPLGNFENPPPYVYPATDGVAVGMTSQEGWRAKYRTNQFRVVVDTVSAITFSNRWQFAVTNESSQLHWRLNQIASARTRSEWTNATSLVLCFVADRDGSGQVNPPDTLGFAEYSISGDAVNLITSEMIPVGSGMLAQSFCVTTVDYMRTGTRVVFAAEPSGVVVYWSSQGAGNPLARKVFNDQYVGQGWHSIAPVSIPGQGEGLVGLLVNPTAANECKVILWPPQSQLQTTGVVPQTPPLARVLPNPSAGANAATVAVRLWDGEGNAALPLLQFSPDTTNWFDVTGIVSVDSQPWSLALRVAALPGGSDHTLIWNAGTMFPPGITNIFLRARATDITLLGDWSEPMPYRLTITLDSDGDGLPDDWEMVSFGNLNQTASGDADGDGFNNMAEYLAGTNPTDANSSLRITLIQPLPGAVRIDWRGGTSGVQVLQAQNALAGTNWLDLFSTSNFAPGTNTYTITNLPPLSTPEFFRIQLNR
jgi:hypothetical protein